VLLVHGTVEEVVAGSGLTTYLVNGENLAHLAAELAQAPGVDMVAPFGTSLHVSGRDRAALQASIARWRGDPALTWTVSHPTLEDVFIELMNRSRGNLQ
jgi:ABC-2 type transport system ATP-binding protein